MVSIFIRVLNMSIAALISIVAVLLLRLVLKRAPKIFSYLLWLAVFFKLLIPYSFQTQWGIIPCVSLEGLGVALQGWEEGHSQNGGGGMAYPGMEKEGGNVKNNDTMPEDTKRKDSLAALYKDNGMGEKELPFLTVGLWTKAAGVWLLVSLLLILCGAVRYVAFMKYIRQCGKAGEQIWDKSPKSGFGGNYSVLISSKIREPFVAGFFKPVIYLPCALEPAQRRLVTLHEEVHIVRRDYLVKLAAHFCVCLHWFNPFVWLSYYLMEQDMETSCDEMVLARIGFESKKEYAKTLLYLSGERGWRSGIPLTFGKMSVKVRIKNIMKYKQIKKGVAAAISVVALASSVLLLVNGSENKDFTALPEEKMTAKGGITGGNEGTLEEEMQLPAAEKMMQSDNSNEQPSDTLDHHYYLSNKQAAEETQNKQKADLSEKENAERLVPLENMEEASNEQAGSVTDSYDSLRRTAEGTGSGNMVAYRMPVEIGRISDDFGIRTHPVSSETLFHSGIDFAAEKGTLVFAAADGIVFETGFDKVAGNYVILQHENGEMTYYANCEEVLVNQGDKAAAGEQIATVGSTGTSTGAHLHFALSREGAYIEPVFTEFVSGQ